MPRNVVLFVGALAVLLTGCFSAPQDVEQNGRTSTGDSILPDGGYHAVNHVVDLEGNTGVETSIGIMACYSQSLQGGNNDWLMFGENGTLPEAVDLVLEWSAASPTTAELVVEITPGESCGHGCISYDSANVRQFRGESPLAAKVDPIASNDGFRLVLVEIIHDPVATEPPMTWTHAELDQDFSIHGKVRLRVPA